MARTRTRDQRFGQVGNLYTYPPFESLVVQSALVGPVETCTDENFGNRKDPNAFQLVRVTQDFGVFSGTKFVGPNPVKRLTNCPGDYRPSPPVPQAKFSDFSSTDISNLSWQALSKTNINVPEVNLPAFFAELKDLPMLFRAWGNSLLQRVATGHLSYRWAIRPMVSDILKLVNFTRSVNERIVWLTRLRDGDGVLKRRATLGTDSDVDSPTTVAVKSAGAFITGRRTVTYTSKVWATVQWKLASNAIIPNPGPELEVLATRLAFGINSAGALAALWEIMPWSWLVDWFLGISTVMSATNNTLPLRWSRICIMRTREAIATVVPYRTDPDSSWCTFTGKHEQKSTWKERRVGQPSLPFVPSVLPLFDAGKWSILGSLAVLKLRL